MVVSSLFGNSQSFKSVGADEQNIFDALRRKVDIFGAHSREVHGTEKYYFLIMTGMV